MDIAEIDEKGEALLFWKRNSHGMRCSRTGQCISSETEIVLERAQQLTAVPGQFYLFCVLP